MGWYIQSAKINCQPRTLYLAELLFKNKKETKNFPGKQSWGNLSLLDLPYKNTLIQVEMKGGVWWAEIGQVSEFIHTEARMETGQFFS